MSDIHACSPREAVVDTVREYFNGTGNSEQLVNFSPYSGISTNPGLEYAGTTEANSASYRITNSELLFATLLHTPGKVSLDCGNVLPVAGLFGIYRKLVAEGVSASSLSRLFLGSEISLENSTIKIGRGQKHYFLGHETGTGYGRNKYTEFTINILNDYILRAGKPIRFNTIFRPGLIQNGDVISVGNLWAQQRELHNSYSQNCLALNAVCNQGNAREIQVFAHRSSYTERNTTLAEVIETIVNITAEMLTGEEKVPIHDVVNYQGRGAVIVLDIDYDALYHDAKMYAET